ncbi:MAG: serine hydrolase [Desulfobacteraceae bacterium]|nr:serine hydrolase [Desulfobacteraceae bacterium]
MRFRKYPARIALGLMIIMLTSVCWYLFRAIPIGTGYAAKYLCSGVFVAKRAPGVVFENDIKPVNVLARIIRARVDETHKTATATALGIFKSSAIYRKGCGCTLVVGTDVDTIRRQHIPDLTKNPIVEDIPWPFGDEGPVTPLPEGVDGEGIETALDRAFAEPAEGNLRQTRAVVVAWNGQLIAERYAPGFDRHTRLPGWSMTKSIVNAVAGILVHQKRLDLQQPAPVTEWQSSDDPRKTITIDHLLRMSSGLVFDETYGPLHDVTEMLYGSFNMAAYAARKKSNTMPDRIWNYSSGTANIMARIIREAAGGSIEKGLLFIHEELFQKIGMHSAIIELDASGTPVGSSYAHAAARDWARFGQLFLNDGHWQGQRILPEGWVDYSTTPTPRAPRGKYGAHFWLNGGSSTDKNNRPVPALPGDAFWANGFQGQRVMIIPSKRLVVVRLGLTSEPHETGTDKLVADIVAALPDIDFN